VSRHATSAPRRSSAALLSEVVEREALALDPAIDLPRVGPKTTRGLHHVAGGRAQRTDERVTLALAGWRRWLIEELADLQLCAAREHRGRLQTSLELANVLGPAVVEERAHGRG